MATSHWHDQATSHLICRQPVFSTEVSASVPVGSSFVWLPRLRRPLRRPDIPARWDVLFVAVTSLTVRRYAPLHHVEDPWCEDHASQVENWKSRKPEKNLANFELLKNQIKLLGNKLFWFEWHQKCLTSRGSSPEAVVCGRGGKSSYKSVVFHYVAESKESTHSTHLCTRDSRAKKCLHGSRGPVELPKNTWNLSISQRFSALFQWYSSFQNVDTWPYVNTSIKY